jgi:uncharacterized protein (DUF1778 family)
VVVTNWHHYGNFLVALNLGSKRLNSRFTLIKLNKTSRLPKIAVTEIFIMATKQTLERGRITARVPQLVVDELEEAAALVGSTVNQFLVQAATEKARSIIETHTRVDLSRRDAAFIAKLLDNPPEPTFALRQAVQNYKKVVTHVATNRSPKKRASG